MNIVGAIVLAFLSFAIGTQVFPFLIGFVGLFLFSPDTDVLRRDIVDYANIFGFIFSILLGFYVYDRLRGRKFGFKKKLTKEIPKV